MERGTSYQTLTSAWKNRMEDALRTKEAEQRKWIDLYNSFLRESEHHVEFETFQEAISEQLAESGATVFDLVRKQ